MERKVVKVGAVKTDRNRSRSEPKVGVSCTCGLLVAWGPGCCATLRIPSRSEEAAIPHAYPSLGKVRNPNYVVPKGKTGADIDVGEMPLLFALPGTTPGIGDAIVRRVREES